MCTVMCVLCVFHIQSTKKKKKTNTKTIQKKKTEKKTMLKTNQSNQLNPTLELKSFQNKYIYINIYE